jgi:DNA polymerase III gamma/tau subunit
VKLTGETFPSIKAALDTCGDGSIEEVKIVPVEASGIDQVRAIVETIKYLAPGGGKKALIIQPYSLSLGGFNALAKVLEEPPKHVRILLVYPDATP